VPDDGSGGGQTPTPLVPPTYPGYGPSPNQGETWDSSQLRGIFTRGGAVVRITDIADGTSNTLMIGESLVGEHYGVSNGDGLPGWWASGWTNSLGTTIVPINYYSGVGYNSPNAQQCSPDPAHSFFNWNVSMGFKSKHTGGANFVFADGSVHFLNQAINMQTYQYLGCRNDGQVLPTIDY
jgi:prepilin-type processing-associated H-X9-DG protein